MKYLPFILCILLFKVGFSQQKSIVGKYVSENNYVVLTDSTIRFKTQYGCCLSVTMYGYGLYKLENDTIYYSPDLKENTIKPNYKIIEDLDSSSKTRICLKDSNEYVSYCSIVLREKQNDNLIKAFVSDSNGVVLIENIDRNNFEEIVVKPLLFGYGKIEIPLSEISGKSIVLDISNARDHLTASRPALFTLHRENGSLKIIGPTFPPEEVSSKERREFRRMVIKGTIFRAWPWDWNFNFNNGNHTPIPTIFVKQ